MIAQGLIARKRDGGRITAEEWGVFARGVASGEIADYQAAALLMAVYLNGLDRTETAGLMDAMLQSGDRLDLASLGVPRIDKHSTGGVGDKVSILLAPIIASLGVAVPMMSGRGLGHTGGTLDKLEAIPGFRTDLSLDEARRQVERLGCALIGQTGEIAPADRKLYALRNATATVESIPLIAASIMSKKLAEGLTGLVLDVKRGSGAFLPELERGLELSRTMIELGTDRGCPVTVLVTAMDRPLGRACGNALEIEESIMGLRGEGPDDLMAVTYALGAEMLLLAGVASSRDDAVHLQQEAVASGKAAAKLQEIIEAQGGNPGVVDDPATLPQAALAHVVEAAREGVIAAVEPRGIGVGVVAMRGGRTRVTDAIDPASGYVITARPGDRVERGTPLATVYASDEESLRAGTSALLHAIRISDTMEATPLPLISHRVTSEGVETLASMQ
ncbi:MAG: thymidine phosphorylase [Gemmatimonadaceae bacterium]|nr:thymidine phosphorylase [Gemmatimonadaceae bacterium]